MPAHLISGLIVVAGLINFAPLMGVVSKGRLAKLYGLDISDPALELLMRHRAMLFGVLGGFMIIAAFKPAWQMPAIVMGLVSMVSFIVLAKLIPDSAKAMQGIIWADVVGIVCLVAAWVLMLQK